MPEQSPNHYPPIAAVLMEPLMPPPDRIGQLEVMLARLESTVESGFEDNKSAHASVRASVEKIEDRILGNGHLGLSRTVEAIKTRVDVLTLVIGAVGLSVLGLLFDLIRRVLL